jgi:transposase
VLGVDDWAFQKGRTYGTILVDGETHRALDLLPDRTAETLIAWLQTHPGSAIVTRDRAPAYAAAVSAAAPNAVQIADRWHLLKNLREMLQRLFDRHRRVLAGTSLPLPPRSPHDRERRRDRGYEQRRADQLGRRAERWAAVQTLHQQGHAIIAIARQLTIARQTVRRYIASTEPPPCARPSRRPSRIDPFVAILQAQWDAGHQATALLFQAVHAAGYRGSTRAVAQWALLRRERQRGPAQHERRAAQHPGLPPTTVRRTPQVPAARTLAWILVKTGDHTAEETQWFQRMRTVPVIETCYQFALRFGRMVRDQTPDALGPWLDEARASTIPELMTFAAGLAREEPAIAAALRLRFSNGPTEGQVTRLKQLRRAMDGRGSFDLVKRRFLLTQQAG